MAARWGEIKDSFASVKQILAYPKMTIYFGSDTLYNVKAFRIFSFIITADIRGDEQIAESSGHFLSNEQRHLISILKPGSKLIFDDIRAIGDGGCTRMLNPFTLTIR